MARLAQCSSMHVVGPPSAAGSAFCGDRIHSSSAREAPCSEHGHKAAFPGIAVFNIIFNRAHSAPASRRHDEATRWWFDQADRKRPIRAEIRVVSHGKGRGSSRWRVATPLTVQSFGSRAIGGIHWFRRRYRQKAVRGATRWRRVTAGRIQVQQSPAGRICCAGRMIDWFISGVGAGTMKKPAPKEWILRQAGQPDHGPYVTQCVRYGSPWGPRA